MKKLMLFCAAMLVMLATTANAQIVTDGDFEAGSAASWQTWDFFGSTATFTFDYQADGPTSGTVGALRMQPAAADSHGGVYQQITLEGGHTYQFDGLAKEVSADPTSTWLEVWVGQTVPTNGTDFNAAAGATNVTKINTWACPGFEGFFVDGCETPADGQFTVPGSGSQTWYMLIKTGVCCSGGAAEYVIDDVVVTDLGAGPTFDEPPTFFEDDFNDGDDTNNYGGDYEAFAGGDPGGTFTLQDGNIEAVSEDATGTTGAAGDFGLHVHATSPINGDSFTYFGVVINLSPSGTIGQNLSAFDTLSFDIRLGNASATDNWAVRLEDTLADDNNAGSYNHFDLGTTLTSTGTNYTTVSFALDDFVNNADGGTIAPNLASVDVVTIVSQDTTVLDSDPDIYIDNVQITGPTSVLPEWTLYH